MRIYSAGFYLFTRQHLFGVKEKPPAMAPFEGYDPDHALESYHYIYKSFDMMAWLRERKRSIFLDSGAFSAFTLGAKIDLEAYSKFIRDWGDCLDCASNVDIIGAGNEQGGYDNQKLLEKMGATVCPVHHARDQDYWLERYLDEGYDYIFLGGMVPESTTYLKLWLDRVWGKYLTNKDGTPKVKVHGFGLTTESLMYRYPWYSVDSTSWLAGNMRGACMIDLVDPYGNPCTQTIGFAENHIDLVKYGKHFDNLAPDIQKKVLEIIEKNGYKIEDLHKMYGSRSKWNIDYFKRQAPRACKRFILEQEGLF